MSIDLNTRTRRNFWPVLALALLLIISALLAVQMVANRLLTTREQELLIHAERVASALKAQIFERYADSQAFSLLPILRKALIQGSATDRQDVRENLDRLLDLYKVYHSSALFDLDGKVIAASSAFTGEKSAHRPNARLWAEDPRLPRTLVSEMLMKDSDPSGDTLKTLQTFSSPVLSSTGAVLGMITNFASPLYLERELQLAFEGFRRLSLPSMRILIIDNNGRVIANANERTIEYLPSAATSFELDRPSGIRSETNAIRAWHNLSDPRIGNAVNWSVVLETDPAAFFAEVNRLKWSAYALALLFLALVFYSAALVHRLRLEHQRQLTKSFHDAQEDERSRISRELHDDLGQTLTAIKIHLSRAQSAPSTLLPGMIDESKGMIEEATQVLRRLSQELHPSLIENLGLVDSVRWKLDQIEATHRIRCQLVVDDDTRVDRLALATQVHVFRMIQESLNNSLKHARCTEIAVRFSQKKRDLTFSVVDNGKGFGPSDFKISLGLRSLQERARLLNAKLRIRSKPGQGTAIICRVPVPLEGVS